MPTYVLTTAGWIPMVWLPEQQRPDDPDAIGLRQVLTEAHHIQEVVADSPLETVAIYRLLQALFLCLYPESSEREAWFELWHKGRFDAQRISDYFDKWQGEKNRFDLFDEQRPFYGHPNPDKPNEGPLTWLFHERARNNNPTLFDHTTNDSVESISPAKAVRGILSTHCYGMFGLPGPGYPYYFGGHLLGGIVFWLRGGNLFQALLLNTPPTLTGRMPSSEAQDRRELSEKPAWERDEPPKDRKRPEYSYLDFLTWQSRHIKLITNDEGTLVKNVWIRRGNKWESNTTDPLMAHYQDSGVKTLRFSPAKALWRDAHILMSLLDEKKTVGPPATFSWLANNVEYLAESGAEGLLWFVDAFGLANKKAEVLLMRHERLPIYPQILRSQPLQNALKDALEQAERQRDLLSRACRICAKTLVKLRKAKEITDVVRALGVEPRYWAALGSKFEAWVDHLAHLEDPEPNGEYASDAFQRQIDVHLARWTELLYRTARDAYEEATASLVESPRQFEAVARGRNELRPAAAYKKILEEA